MKISSRHTNHTLSATDGGKEPHMPLTDLVRYLNTRDRDQRPFLRLDDPFHATPTGAVAHYARITLESDYAPIHVAGSGSLHGHAADDAKAPAGIAADLLNVASGLVDEVQPARRRWKRACCSIKPDHPRRRAGRCSVWGWWGCASARKSSAAASKSTPRQGRARQCSCTCRPRRCERLVGTENRVRTAVKRGMTPLQAYERFGAF